MTSSAEALSRNPMMQLGGLLGDWPEHPEMQFVEQVTGYRVDGPRVLFACRTNLGEMCTVVLTACSEHVLQLTLVPQGEPIDRGATDPPVPIVVTEQPAAVTMTVVEETEWISIRLGALTAVA